MNYEQFLSDRRCCFKNTFVLTDTSLNDSMIRPIKLSIPKKPKQNNYLNDNSKSPESKEKITQNTDSFTNNNQNITKDEIKQSPIKVTVTKNDDLSLIDEKNPKINDKNYQNPNLEPKSIQLTKNNLFESIPRGSVLIFHMKIDKKNPISVVPVENPTENICFISKERKKRTFSYHISLDNSNIATVTQISHDSFYSTANINNEQCEISAQVIQNKSKEFKIQLFQAFFPKNGQPIIFNGNSSVLLKNENNRIEMGPRLPKLKGGIPVMYFGGRIKKESVQNFILETHDDGCTHFTFGKVDDETFVGEVYYPLSPIQAISIAVSHFR